MTTVKFDKSVKYMGVRYAAHEAFKVADEDVNQLRQAGATVLSVDAVPNPEKEERAQGQAREKGEDVDQLKQDLLEYTVPELVKFAEERGIDLQKKTRKAEIYNVIVASLN